MNEKKATPNDEAAPKNLLPEFTVPTCDTIADMGIDAAAQRRRVLAALRDGPKSTIVLRRDWDILCPAARVLELRKEGCDIYTMWAHQETDCGALHRVALYVLIREAGDGEKSDAGPPGGPRAPVRETEDES